METKFKLIETEEYTLAVSDEDASNSYIYFTGDPTGIFRTGIKYKNEAGDYFYQDAITGMSNTYLAEISKKIIGCLPKGNAPGLLHIVKLPSDENVNVQKISRLPLLPEIVVENDIEKLAKDLANEQGGDDIILRSYIYASFIEGHKAATKVYSEEDLRKAIEMARVKDWQKDSNGDNFWEHSRDEIIQSLKQPKWFVAEIEVNCTGNNNDGCFMDSCGHNCGCLSLKTTTINNKTYLVGTYLN